MKRVFVLLLTLIVPLLRAETLHNHNGPTRYPKIIHIGYVLEGVPQYQIADLKIAFENLLKRYAASDDLKADIHYYDYSKEAVKDFMEKKIDTISGPSLLWAKHHKQILPRGSLFYIAKKCDALYERYLLLRNKGMKTDKRRYSLLLPYGDFNAMLFVKHDTLSRLHTIPDNYYRIGKSKKASIAIYQTFFNKADYAVVPESAWQIALEMNPDIANRLTVVSRSPKVLFYGAGCYANDLDPKLLERIRRSHAALEKSIMGQQLLAIIQIKGNAEVDIDAFTPFLDYVNETERLEAEWESEAR